MSHVPKVDTTSQKVRRLRMGAEVVLQRTWLPVGSGPKGIATGTLPSHFQRTTFPSTSREHKVNCPSLTFIPICTSLHPYLISSQSRALASEVPSVLVIICLDSVLS